MPIGPGNVARSEKLDWQQPAQIIPRIAREFVIRLSMQRYALPVGRGFKSRRPEREKAVEGVFGPLCCP